MRKHSRQNSPLVEAGEDEEEENEMNESMFGVGMRNQQKGTKKIKLYGSNDDLIESAAMNTKVYEY